MLHQPEHAWPGGREDLARLVGAHPWVTLVSATPALVVSHLPVVLDPAADQSAGPVLLGHLPLADARAHRLGEAETVVVVYGPHGYVSAGWYAGGPYVSTWNYVVAHLHGTLTRLDAAETFGVLELTQERFESVRPEPFVVDRAYAERLAPHVVGFRLTPARVEAKAKLSQDKPAEDVAGVLRGLEDSADVHANPALAAAMRELGGVAR
ncbi:FMN-binding negative transcriptional regulator [Nocardioides sp.]|uniref:FMN-binding negative transcriptional regulator n=1 Tax=Nocardioides sp. TaxID=35761 RepID=UPI0039E67A6F